jgi:predicted CxxxxCH...CXXCH cytochrome family protein
MATKSGSVGNEISGGYYDKDNSTAYNAANDDEWAQTNIGSTSSCRNISCHGGAGTATPQWGVGTEDCTTCHDTSLTKNLGSGGTIRQVTGAGGDFTLANRHVYGGTVTKWDCIVCHREGEETAGPSQGKTNKTYHNDTGGAVAGSIDLRNVDTPTTGWEIDNKAWTPAYYKAQDDFCLTCHDADGAAGIAVVGNGTGITLTPTVGEAQGPFNDTDGIGTGGNAASGPTGFRSRTRVTDVNEQFNPGSYSWPAGDGTMPAGFTGGNYDGNQSQHAVRGPRYFTNNAGWGTGSGQYWTANTLKSGQSLKTVRETAQLHCADCHLVDQNAHGSSKVFMLIGDPTNSFTGTSTIDATCYLCHEQAVHENGSGGRWDHSNDGSVWSGGKETFWDDSYCFLCHGGGNGAEAYIAQYGGIHGLNGADTLTGEPRWRFQGGAYLSPNPGDNGEWTITSGSVVCYGQTAANKWSNCSRHDGGSDNEAGYNYSRGTAY